MSITSKYYQLVKNARRASLDLESDKMMLRKQISHILHIDLLENDQVQSAVANCQGVPVKYVKLIMQAHGEFNLKK